MISVIGLKRGWSGSMPKPRPSPLLPPSALPSRPISRTVSPTPPAAAATPGCERTRSSSEAETVGWVEDSLTTSLPVMMTLVLL